MKRWIYDFLNEKDDLGYLFTPVVIVAGICVILYWIDKIGYIR